MKNKRANIAYPIPTPFMTAYTEWTGTDTQMMEYYPIDFAKIGRNERKPLMEFFREITGGGVL